MKPKYSIIKDYLKEKITNHEYQAHEKISSESSLMKQFNVSRHTVRMAIGDLVSEGWLYRKQGSGTFCNDTSALKSGHDPSIKKIAIITTYISDYIFPSIIRGAENLLSQYGYNVSIFSTNNNYEMEKDVLEKIIAQHFDGVIVEPTQSAMSNPNLKYYLNLEKMNIPYVMIHAFYEELNPISVTMNDELGGFMQAEYLINQGHKNIIGIFKTDDDQGVKRMKGYLKAHRKYNLNINPDYVITYETTNKSSKPVHELKKLLKNHQKVTPSAIVSYNDEITMDILNFLRSENLSVPDDFSVISYDNSFFADISEVKLTSVDHPKSKMGEAAAKTIMQMIEQLDSTDKNVTSTVFEPKIIERHSVRTLNHH